MKISLARLAAVAVLVAQSEAFFCLIRPLFKPIPILTIPIGGGGGGGGGGTGPATSCPKPACAKKACGVPQCLPLPDPEVQAGYLENCRFNGYSGGVFNDNGSGNKCI